MYNKFMLVKDTFSYFLELFNIMLWLFENGIGTMVLLTQV